MKITRVLIQTNCHRDGFFTETLTQHGDGPFYAHMCSDKVFAFNSLTEHLEVNAMFYAKGQFFRVLAIDVTEL
jgi:hypothetical protein